MQKAVRAGVYGLFALSCIGVFVKPAVCAAGVQTALRLCAKTLVPSLFPFLVLSGFFLRSGFCTVCGARLAPLTRRLFRLPGESAGVVLLSMLGGFPVGIKMTAQLFKDGVITQKQAQKMCLFCFNAGPAFVVSALGAGVYGSTRIGFLLYGALCLSACTLGLLLRFTDKKSAKNEPKYDSRVVRVQFSAAFTKSVSDALQTTLQICAWVALFGGVSAMVEALPLPESIHLLFLCITEVTNGAVAAAAHLPLPAVAAVVSFGGLAVHCQVLADLLQCRVCAVPFFTARIGGAVLAALYCFILLKIFPCEVGVFAGSTPLTHAASSVSVPAGAALLLCAVLFLWEVETKKKVCYNTDKVRGFENMEKHGKIEIAPKCEYCVHARPSPDGETVLCPKKGVMEKDSKCRKYKYDILKRRPKKKPKLQEFSAEDFEL